MATAGMASIGRVAATHSLAVALFAVSLLYSSTSAAADAYIVKLDTIETAAQLRPGIREPLEEAGQMAAFDRPEEALALLEPLRPQLDSGTLNYWETFDFHFVQGEAQRRKRAWREALAAFEECNKFADIDSYRRVRLLLSLGNVYAQLKEAERAISTYEELDRLRGGRDPQAATLIAQVHDQILGDRNAAISYFEDAVRYGENNPQRRHYALLRRAYILNRDLERALAVASAMVDLFEHPNDAAAMDDIVKRMNRTCADRPTRCAPAPR